MALPKDMAAIVSFTQRECTEEYLLQKDWQKDFFYNLRQFNLYSISDSVLERPCFPSFEIPFGRLSSHMFSQDLSIYNKEIIEKIKALFFAKFPELAHQTNLCIMTTGSDGREEKRRSVTSPLDLIILVRDKDGGVEESIKKIELFIKENPKIFCQEWELKFLDSGHLLCYEDQLKKEIRPFPTIGLDALYVQGDSSIFRSYKDKYFDALQGGEANKLVNKFYKHSIKQHLQYLEAAISGESHDLCLETGTLNYDGRRVKGSKFALLRVVQYTLAHKIFKSIIKGKIDKQSFSEFPCSTIERIDWLVSKNILKMDEHRVDTLKNPIQCLFYGLSNRSVCMKWTSNLALK